MAERGMSKSEFEKSTQLCPRCGWFGLGREADRDHYEECFDYCCPSCGKPLAVYSALAWDDEGS